MLLLLLMKLVLVLLVLVAGQRCRGRHCVVRSHVLRVRVGDDLLLLVRLQLDWGEVSRCGVLV